MSSKPNPGNKGKLLKGQGQYKTDPYGPAIKSIDAAVAANVGKVDAGKTAIRAILNNMLYKVSCPAGVTRPDISGYNDSGATLKEVKASALTFINKVKGVCPFKPGTPGTPGTPGKPGMPGSSTDPTRLTIDPELLAGKIIGILGRNKATLEEIRAKVQGNNLGDKDLPDSVGKIKKKYNDVLRFFTTRFAILERETDEARRLIVGLKMVDPEAYKRVYGKLQSMYNQLFSYDTTSARDRSASSLIDWINLSDATGSTTLKEGLDLTSALLSFQAIVEGGSSTGGPSISSGPPPKSLVGTNLIDTSVSTLKNFDSILTSTDSYFYFQDSNKGFARFSTPDFYAKIGAVNGFGFLKLVEYYNTIMAKGSEKDKFAYQSMICKYLFRVPDGKTMIPFDAEMAKNTTESAFKKQMLFLAIIHQLHFIGTLLDLNGIQASEDSTSKGSADTEAAKKEKSICGIRDDAKKETTRLQKELVDLDTKIALNESVQTDMKEKLKVLPPIPMGLIPEVESFKQIIQVTENQLKIAINDLKTTKQTYEQAKKEKDEAEAKVNAFTSSTSGGIDVLLQDLTRKSTILTNREQANKNQIKIVDGFKKAIDDTLIQEIEHPITSVSGPFKTSLNRAKVAEHPGIMTYAITKRLKVAEDEIAALKLEKPRKEVELKTAELDLVKKEEACKAAGGRGSFGQRVPPFSPPAGSSQTLQDVLVAKYNYTRSFVLSSAAAPLTVDAIDTWIQNLYKEYRDDTFYLQTLQKIKTQLEVPGGLLPSAPGAPGGPGGSGGPGGPPKPGLLTGAIEDAMKEGDLEVGVHLTQLSATIQRSVIAFLHKYTLDSIVDEKKRETVSRSDKSLTIADYDDMLRQGLKTLTSKLNGKPDLIPIKEEAVRIQNIIQEYIRTKS